MATMNVQADLVVRLREAFPQATVARHVPAKMPDRLIAVERSGGRRLNRLQDRPGVSVDVYAPTENETAILAGEVSDFMQSLGFPDGYEKVVEEGCYSSPDPDTKAARWHLEYTVTTHAAS